MAAFIEWIAVLARRVRFYINRERFERELAEEMRFHEELKSRDHEHAGMSAVDAAYAARRRFGNARRHQDAASDVMAVGWVETLAQDGRYAIRALRGAPAFTAVAVGSVALGIGATTAIFTLVNAMLLRPLPYRDAGALVLGFQTITPGVFMPVDSMPWSYDGYQRLRELVPAFSDLGFSSWDEFNLRRTGPTAGSPPEPASRVRAELVTTSLFSTLGTMALLGRGIEAADSVPVSTGVPAVLSEALWRRQFAGDPAVVGSSAMLDKLPVTIIGVMPASFTGIRESVEMWVPREAAAVFDSPERRRQAARAPGAVVGRLAPNATVAMADAQIKAAARSLNAVNPPPRFGPRDAVWSAGVVDFADARRHPLIRPLLTLLSIAVTGVLVIVCANLAGLLLARARAREAELGIRIALGAGRGRLVRQMLTECLVLAMLGVVPGLLIAYGGAVALARLRPTLPPNYVLLRSVDLLRGVSLAPDWRVLTFALLLTLIVGLLFGALPALAASRTNIAELIKVAANRGSSGRARGRRTLVIGQIALATVLLVGAGLTVRSFRALLQSDTGFTPDHVLQFVLTGGDSVAATPGRRAELLQRIGALPGVVATASFNCAPLGGDCVLMPVTRVDARAVQTGEYPPMESHFVSGDFLRAAGIPLRLGRAFDSREPAGSLTAAIINESAARLLWGAESPLGRRVSTRADSAPPVEVIGVVADVKYETLEAPVRPAIYYLSRQFGAGDGSAVMVRTLGDPTAVIPAIRRIVAAADPTAALSGVMTGEAVMARAASSSRFVATLLIAFGVVAAVLAALGVYGVLAYLVTQRRREFGVRMAIGAQPSSLLALVVRQGAMLTLVGLVAGVIGAMVASRFLSSFLFGVTPSDVPTYVAIVGLVGVTGLLAALIPARRATRVDPVSALRD